MSIATAAITDKFKSTYVQPEAGDTTDLQKAFFAMGFRWGWQNAREVDPDVHDAGYIRVDSDFELHYGSGTQPNRAYFAEHTKVSVKEVINAAEQVRKIKREEGKASKKRRAQRKWEATATQKTHDGCPVNPGVIVAIKMRDGDVWTEKAGNVAWGECGGGTIESYKVVGYPKAKPAGEVVSVDELFADIASSLGKGVAKVETDTGGWVDCDGSGNMPVPAGTRLDVKFKCGAVFENRTAGYGMARELYWEPSTSGVDIVAYRVIDEANVAASTSESADRERLDQIYDALGTSEAIREPAAPVGDVNSNARGSGARFNSGKPDYSLIPMKLLEGEARVWAYGAKKYKAWNWMKGMDWNVPFACAMRHMAAWQAGEDIDPETGESHLDHAMCNLRMLRYYADFYKEGDNRPKEFFEFKEAD